MSIGRFTEILKGVKENSFVAGYKPTDQEILGIAISKYFKWSGLPILETTYNALEDSNFHTENETIKLLIDKLK